MTDDSNDDRYTGITSLLVLGVGLTALFLDVENWWVIFVIGYAVVLPIVAMLTGEDADGDWDADDSEAAQRSDADESDSTSDALETLRERYATGDLSEAQFERKLERLLETETPEDARERMTAGDRARPGATRGREPGDDGATDQGRASETDRGRAGESERGRASETDRGRASESERGRASETDRGRASESERDRELDRERE